MLLLLGGLALFLFGVRLTGDHLQGLFGAHLKRSLARATRSLPRAAATGFVVSALTQSSTLISLLTVQFAQARILSFREALALALGASVGATLLIQLLTLHLELAFPLLALSLLLRSRRVLGGHLGGVLLGLGLLLLGQQTLLGALIPLQGDALAQGVLAALSAQPLLLLLLGALLTAVIQSSNALTLLVLSLVSARLLNVEQGVVMVLGANVGSTFTAVIQSAAESVLGRRVALAHSGLKLTFALLLALLAAPVTAALTHLEAAPPRLLADAHTLFNVLVLLVGLPLSGALGRVMARWLPTPPSEDAPKYLDAGALVQPELAYGLAYRETVRVAEAVQALYRLAVRALDGSDVRAQVAVQEDTVDTLVNEVIAYLGQLRGRLDETHLRALLAIISELEALADLCKRLARQHGKLEAIGQRLLPERHEDLLRLTARQQQRIQVILTALGTRREPGPDEADFSDAIGRRRLRYLEHLTPGTAVNAHSAFLDMLAILEQVHDGFERIARQVKWL